MDHKSSAGKYASILYQPINKSVTHISPPTRPTMEDKGEWEIGQNAKGTVHIWIQIDFRNVTVIYMWQKELGTARAPSEPFKSML